MASAKRGDKRPCRAAYHKDGRRVANKERRILRCNGEAFLKQWRQDGNGNKT